MAVSAYASVLSLMHVLDQIQHPARCHLFLNKKQIQTLHEKVTFLQEFLEVQSSTKIEGIEDLVMKQINEVANEVEDIIDSHVVDQLRKEYEVKTDDMGLPLRFSEDTNDDHVANHQLHGGSASTVDIAFSSSFCQDMKKVIEKTDSIKKKLDDYVMTVGGFHVVTGSVSNNLVSANDHLSGLPNTIINRSLVDKEIPKDKQTTCLSCFSSSEIPSCGKSTRVVGFDERLIQIMELLTRDQPNLQIIPIVGMGGIGKTALAQCAFEDKCVVEKFDIRVWFTISQQYSVHEILLGVLRDSGVLDDLENESLAELRLRLHQELYGRRYLIVMDDLWSTNGWDDFKSSFPNNRNGSRVMVTTRLTDVAASLASYSPYLMDFLDEEKSWNLLCEKVFSQGSCSPELEEIGKRIARSCRGIPLAIVVVGGLLRNSNMTRKYWESIAENVISYANSENDEHCLKILALSYNHLPIHLKPCFLYMRVFPEDAEIQVSKLIKLWIAEGFLKPSKAKNMENVAEEYLKDLIDRNLILIRKLGCIGKIKTCGVHDLLRDLCVRESHKEHFVCVPKVQDRSFLMREKGDNVCVLCCKRDAQEMIHLSQVHLDTGSTSLVSSFVCNACRIMYPRLITLRFVRIHNVTSDGEYFLQNTRLRYLSFFWIDTLLSPSPIPLLWNLQSLIMDSPDVNSIVLPSEIWEMPQLRHIIINHCYLPDPIVNEIERKDLIVLENLHTLSAIGNFKCTENIFERIPNLKKLRICCNYSSIRVDWSCCSHCNFAYLQKLESLSVECSKIILEKAFPNSLKKLSLSRCAIPWNDMTIIGSLPNLEVLKLSSNAFVGSEWNPIEGEFLRLKFLLLSNIDLVKWRAEHIPFPSLEALELRRMYYLKEIPKSFGEIATLRLIHLVRTYDVRDSAKEILLEQESFGNEGLQVHVTDGKGRTYQL